MASLSKEERKAVFHELLKKEMDYLLANGWERVERGWKEPPGRRDRVLEQELALRAQKNLDFQAFIHVDERDARPRE